MSTMALRTVFVSPLLRCGNQRPLCPHALGQSTSSVECPLVLGWQSPVCSTALGVKSPMQQWVESTVLQLELTDVDSVQQWLFDIRTNTDCESMCILQGKSIPSSPVTTEMTANTIKGNILRLITASRCLSAKFSELHGEVSEDKSHDIWPACHLMIDEIQSMVRDCEGFFVDVPSAVSALHGDLLPECARFKTMVENLELSIGSPGHTSGHLTDQLITLAEQFAEFIGTVQTKLIQALVYTIQDSENELNTLVLVKTVYALITDYPSIKSLLLQEQILGALFQVCLRGNTSVGSLRLLSLQTIAKICQDAEGRAGIQRIGGLSHLTQILSSPTSPEALKIEGAALIGHLISPEVISEYNQSRIHQHLEALLRTLIDLLQDTNDSLMFLVGSSAVANTTFMGSSVYRYLADLDAARVLIEGSRQGKVEGFDSRDQVVTILANMAEDQTCRERIKEADGVPLLINLLQTQTKLCHTQIEGSVDFDAKVCEQIQQKAAIALARLAKDKGCAAQIDSYEGIQIFVRICRTSSYRNKSVPVLIACLAALRRLHHALGPASFQQEDIDKLVRPKMIESIFTCSSVSEESFV